MIYKIDDTQDLMDVIIGDVPYIESIEYYTHNDPENVIEGHRDDVDAAMIKVALCAEELATLAPGQLCCRVKLGKDNSLYCDGKYNETKIKKYNVWKI